MNKNRKSILLAKLVRAKQEITDAETGLAEALAQIRVAPRAEKMTISESVAGAFTKLRGARADLVELEELIKDEHET